MSYHFVSTKAILHAHHSASPFGGLDNILKMPDTYGSPFDQIRGFVEEGWIGLGNREGDISSRSPLLEISLDDFARNIMPCLSSRDTVILLVAAEDASCSVSISEALSSVICVAAATAKLSILAAVSLEDLEVLHNIKFLKDQCIAAATAAIADTSSSLDFPRVASTIVTIPRAQGHDGVYSYTLKLMVNAVSTFTQAKGRVSLKIFCLDSNSLLQCYILPSIGRFRS